MPNHPNTVRFDDWRGLNNKSPSERIEENFLAEATNVDIDASGAIRMRKGYTPMIPGTNCHSLWSDQDKEAFYVCDGTLYKIDPYSTTTRTALTTGLSNARLSYIKVGTRVYYNSLEGDSGVIENNVVRSFGIARPRLVPFYTVTTGQLRAGTYSLSIRYRAEDGRVSGAGVQTTIKLEDDAGILISGIADSPDPSVTHVELFISTPDGEVLYLAETLPKGKTGTHIMDLRGDMVPLDYQFVDTPPPGEMLQLYNGRLYMTDGSRLWYSEPHSFEHWDYSNWIDFESEITNVMPVDDGIFVTAARLIFLEGDGEGRFNFRDRENYRAAKYTGVAIIGGDILMENIPTGLKWLVTTTKGIVMLGTGGLVFNLTERNVMVDNAEVGAAIFKSVDGINQYVSILKDPEANRVHIGDSATADIIRNGIAIT